MQILGHGDRGAASRRALGRPELAENRIAHGHREAPQAPIGCVLARVVADRGRGVQDAALLRQQLTAVHRR